MKRTLDELDIQYSLVVAQDGEEAKSHLLRIVDDVEATPDLILLDMSMPKLTGVEVLRAVPGSEKLPICIVTSSLHESKFVEAHFSPRGVNYLVKPIDRDGLLACFHCYNHLEPLAVEIECRSMRSGKA